MELRYKYYTLNEHAALIRYIGKATKESTFRHIEASGEISHRSPTSLKTVVGGEGYLQPQKWAGCLFCKWGSPTQSFSSHMGKMGEVEAVL